jgi:AcrR family transcriptional regulator
MTAETAISMLGGMPRWEPDAVGRLQEAAFQLFSEQGFDHTTVAEIAQRAGLTERTFFNHFAAKREVVFGPLTERQREIAASAIAACDDAVPPLDAVVHGLQVADKDLEQLRSESTRRREVIDAAPELQEREVAKLAALTAAIAAALRDRGLDADTALFIARAGVLIEQTAEHRWTQPGETRSLHDLLADALASLRGMFG